jgi:CysZ protein
MGIGIKYIPNTSFLVIWVVKDFLRGAGYLVSGVKLLRKHGLRKFVALPLAINIFIYSAAGATGGKYFQKFLNYLMPDGDGILTELGRGILWVLFGLSFLVILFFTFNLIANLLGAPFNGLLSDRVRGYLSVEGESSPSGSLSFLSTLLPSLFSEMRKFFRFMAISLLLFSFSIFPLVNLISPFLWVIFTSWMMSAEYISYPMEQEGKYFSHVRKYIRDRKALTYGFGSAALVMSVIPIANFFVMPAAVMGATALYMEEKGK